MTICSHTLVRNGNPFIGPVLRQVIPFVNRCLVTISKKSSDGTLEELEKLVKEYPSKIYISFEDVNKPAELTRERQKQVDATGEDWILFLDDDDWWPKHFLVEMIEILKESMDMDGLAVNPYQLLTPTTHDNDWRHRFFTKWIKNQPGLKVKEPWPRDLYFVNDKMLYWKKNRNVIKVAPRYFHLSHIKQWSFRNQSGFESYKENKGFPVDVPKELLSEVERIFSYV